jgi:hypothetical protein
MFPSSEWAPIFVIWRNHVIQLVRNGSSAGLPLTAEYKRLVNENSKIIGCCYTAELLMGVKGQVL